MSGPGLTVEYDGPYMSEEGTLRYPIAGFTADPFSGPLLLLGAGATRLGVSTRAASNP